MKERCATCWSPTSVAECARCEYPICIDCLNSVNGVKLCPNCAAEPARTITRCQWCGASLLPIQNTREKCWTCGAVNIIGAVRT